MKISVALASYNGEKYIKEQLDSILNQTLPVDEVIVSDDGSTDSTVEIVKALNDPRIVLLQDNEKHGYAYNFEHALKHTTGDVIFLSDQDDIWKSNKVERYITVFEQDPEIGLVVSDGDIINKDGILIEDESYKKHLNVNLKSETDKKYLQNECYVRSAGFTLANGMCMCISKKLLHDALPFPDTRIGHDHWLSFCASSKSAVYFISESLVQYRIHDANTSFKREQNRFRKLLQSYHRVYNFPYDLHNLYCGIYNRIDKNHPLSCEASAYPKKICQIYEKQIDLFEYSRLRGMLSAFKLYFSDPEYRRHGLKYFLLQVYIILCNRSLIKSNRRQKQKLS